MTQKLKQVVLTRPAGRNQRLNEWLAEAGIASIELPTISIAPLDDEDSTAEITRQLVGQQALGVTDKSLDPGYDCALFISANAVEATASFCRQQAIHWRSELPCLGMGKATEDAIRAQGWRCQSPSEEDNSDSRSSEQLLQSDWSANIAGRRVALIKGTKGRGMLIRALRERGAEVEEISLYRRDPVSYDAQVLADKLQALAGNIGESAIVFASGETMDNFCDLIADTEYEPLLPGLRCLVPTLRVAMLARERGFDKILVAEGASDRAFLRHLLALAR